MLGVQLSQHVHARHRREPGPATTRRARSFRRSSKARRPTRPASRPATSSRRSTAARSPTPRELRNTHRPAAHRRESRHRPAARRQAAPRDRRHRRARPAPTPMAAAQIHPAFEGASVDQRGERRAACWSQTVAEGSPAASRPACARTTSSSRSAACASRTSSSCARRSTARPRSR